MFLIITLPKFSTWPHFSHEAGLVVTPVEVGEVAAALKSRVDSKDIQLDLDFQGTMKNLYAKEVAAAQAAKSAATTSPTSTGATTSPAS